MTPAEALTDIRGYAGANRILYTSHARDRMFQRNITFADARHALMTARLCAAQKDGRWRVDSTDRSGDDLTAIVALERGVVVVTLF